MKFKLPAVFFATLLGLITIYGWLYSFENNRSTVIEPPQELSKPKNLQEFPVLPGKCRPGGISPFATDSSTCDVNASQSQQSMPAATGSVVLLVKGFDVRQAIHTVQPGTKDTSFIYGELLDECLKPEAMKGTDREGCAELLKHRGSWLGKLKVASRHGNQTADELLVKEQQLLALDAFFNSSKIKK